MKRQWWGIVCLAGCLSLASMSAADAQQPGIAGGQRAYGQQWGHTAATPDWNRFYHYPYVWYPQNFYADGYMKSANDLYYRYPQEMRVPVYNRAWHNEYPKNRRYHHGHHFHLDVF